MEENKQGKDSKLKNFTPGDGLFKAVMEDVVVARDFLEYYLSESFKEQIDLSKITIEKESFVEDDLKRALSDIIYKIKTKDNEDAYAFVLIEHQSTPDHLIAFRLWKYMLLLCERHIKKNRNESKDNGKFSARTAKFPLVVPLVFYNGTKRYDAPLNLWELFLNPELAKKLMSEDYKLIDLRSMSDDEIKKKDHLGMIEFMMKHVHTRDMLKLWAELLANFKKAILVDKERGYIYIKHLLWYSDSKVPEDRQQELNDLILENLNQRDGEDIMRTIAQKYIDEGIVQGKSIGIQEGEARGIEKGEARGIEKGEARGIEKAAINMLSQNLAPELIAQYTGLTVKQIKELRDSVSTIH